MPEFSTVVGSVGVALLLVAFVMNVSGRLNTSWVYSWMNLIGSGLAAGASWLIDFIPFVVLEGVWFLAAAVRLIQLAINPNIEARRRREVDRREPL